MFVVIVATGLFSTFFSQTAPPPITPPHYSRLLLGGKDNHRNTRSKRLLATLFSTYSLFWRCSSSSPTQRASVSLSSCFGCCYLPTTSLSHSLAHPSLGGRWKAKSWPQVGGSAREPEFALGAFCPVCDFEPNRERVSSARDTNTITRYPWN